MKSYLPLSKRGEKLLEWVLNHVESELLSRKDIMAYETYESSTGEISIIIHTVNPCHRLNYCSFREPLVYD